MFITINKLFKQSKISLKSAGKPDNDFPESSVRNLNFTILFWPFCFQYSIFVSIKPYRLSMTIGLKIDIL